MRVAEDHRRHLDVHPRAFRQGADFQRQMPQCVQRFQPACRHRAGAQRRIHAALVFAHRLVPRLAEELLVEQIDQVLLDETLQAEPHHLIVEQLRQHRRVLGRAW